MNNKKKILMVHNYYQIGGGEHTVFENEVDMLRKKGHEVVTYTRNNDELKKNRMKLLLLPFTTMWSCKSYREVREIIKKENIDVVHCHNTFPLISPSVYYAARNCNVPVVQTIHNFRFLCPAGIFYCNGSNCEKCRNSGNFMEALKNGCYRNSKIQTLVCVAMLRIHRMFGTYRKISYIFLTEFNRDKFDKLININSDQIYIKPNFVKRMVTESESEDVDTVFVYAGRLEENKGLSFLLDAWERIPVNYQLHIYGDGNLKDRVVQVSEQFENVKYLGFQSHDVIFDDLRKAKALINPSSLYEGFPMTIAESFSIGKPVIATNVGNQKNIIENSKGGVLFLLGDVQSFINAVNEVVSNNDIYSRNAKAYYNLHLNEENNYRKLSDIYEKIKCIN